MVDLVRIERVSFGSKLFHSTIVDNHPTSTHKFVAGFDQVLVVMLLMLERDALLAGRLLAGLTVVTKQFVTVHRAGELLLQAVTVQVAVGEAGVQFVQLVEDANARVVGV